MAKMKQTTLNDIVQRTLSGQRRNIEPVQRMCGGTGPCWVRHRFDIKGGISALDLLVANVTQNNALFTRLQARRDVDVLADAVDAVMARHEAPFIADLQRIGEAIGYGRAQQVLGELWEQRHGCAPRGRMGVTVPHDG